MSSITYFRLKESLLCSLFCLVSILVSGQEELHWSDPIEQHALSGRIPQVQKADGYLRLPSSMEDEVRDAVWRLAKDDAGVYVDFTTTADYIEVAYTVSKNLSMPHMPATGVSGLDLYARSADTDQWGWIHGKYDFSDTVRYSFKGFQGDSLQQYRLYLPLYNAVTWLEIGVAKENDLHFNKSTSRPIVVYGTSIAQGACASRPGLAWTNRLGRVMDHEVINLGFSGNGRLEAELLHLIRDVDASVFILDCIPNLSAQGEGGEEKLARLIEDAVAIIREKHVDVPIVFAAHSASQVDGVLNFTTTAEYDLRSEVAERTVKKLVKEGDSRLFWLSTDALDMDKESTVDYAHPNDYGMGKIADAYHRLLSEIL